MKKRISTYRIRIAIEMDEQDDDADFGHATGLTNEAYERLTRHLPGAVVEIEKED